MRYHYKKYFRALPNLKSKCLVPRCPFFLVAGYLVSFVLLVYNQPTPMLSSLQFLMVFSLHMIWEVGFGIGLGIWLTNNLSMQFVCVLYLVGLEMRLDPIKIKSPRNSTQVRHDLFFPTQIRLNSSSRTTRFDSITRIKRTKTKKK